MILFSGTNIVTLAFYWTSAMMFLLMDYTQQPAFLMKYKMQQGKNTPPNTAKVIKVSSEMMLGKNITLNKPFLLSLQSPIIIITLKKKSRMILKKRK